jgi:hypothetical protein
VALLLLLAAAGCAAPPPVREAPIAYPSSVRERILRIAEAEWVEWGRLLAGPGLPALPAGTEGGTEAFPRVLAYWRAVPEAEAGAAIARNRGRWSARLAGDAEAGVWSEPAWSAAFVSYVMRGAGVDEREFHASASHSFYLDAILRDALEFPDRAPFLPHDPTAHAPALGDLVCADRSRHPLASWRDRLAEMGKFRPMHCDIVLRINAGAVEAVGGNVADAVTLTAYPADSAGRLLPRAPGDPVIVTVIENRLGRLPPFAPGPLISALGAAAR